MDRTKLVEIPGITVVTQTPATHMWLSEGIEEMRAGGVLRAQSRERDRNIGGNLALFTKVLKRVLHFAARSFAIDCEIQGSPSSTGTSVADLLSSTKLTAIATANAVPRVLTF